MEKMRVKPRMVSGLKNLIKETGLTNAHLVEIGSYLGESTKIFADSKSFSKISCIDPWVNNYAKNDKAAVEFDMNLVFSDFLRRMVDDLDIIDVYRLTSEEAVKEFQDESLDMVYIDGNHSYEFVKQDIQLWKPKIKKGGFLTGHDWHKKVIRKAVVEVIGEPQKTFEDDSWLFKV